MKVLKATLAQYKAINDFKHEASKLEFQKDANDNWIVGLEVLEDESFADIKEQLLQLEEIEFEPKTVNSI